MTLKSSSKLKWAVTLAACALHPVLLYVLFPLVGERSNLAAVAAPLVATLFFSWRVAIVFILINVVVTAVMFTHLAGQGPTEGPPKAIAFVLVVTAVCFGVDMVKRFVQKGKAMKAELERLRRPGPPEA